MGQILQSGAGTSTSILPTVLMPLFHLLLMCSAKGTMVYTGKMFPWTPMEYEMQSSIQQFGRNCEPKEKTVRKINKSLLLQDILEIKQTQITRNNNI